ncbi:glutathione S-transferase family protein [Pectobacterium brasiliense]|uniref:glutathione S-transferase family protein n=1 Tax=Pectobacterium brasiliense TaxID=180957 RepID=UPI001969F608|nr:glutathione S-transferase family protein [Pectobacterium brasiliense]MBN3341623.1 glutathione S-transferase family protein [Pectobacterium brasiliense]
MKKPILFGASYSVYVRIVQFTLQEKGISYDLIPVDIFDSNGSTDDYLERHPFGKIPSFEHDAFRLYETGAITRYIDEAFDGPRLQPMDVKQRARMNQIISIADGYMYPYFVWGMYGEVIIKASKNEPIDRVKLDIAIQKTSCCLAALSTLLDENFWLSGEKLTLADIYVAPMIDYLIRVPQGQDIFSLYPNLTSWWSRIMPLMKNIEHQTD